MNDERPQVMEMRVPSLSIVTGAGGSERAMSASRRPETREVPSVATSAEMSTRPETS